MKFSCLTNLSLLDILSSITFVSLVTIVRVLQHCEWSQDWPCCVELEKTTNPVSVAPSPCFAPTIETVPVLTADNILKQELRSNTQRKETDAELLFVTNSGNGIALEWNESWTLTIYFWRRTVGPPGPIWGIDFLSSRRKKLIKVSQDDGQNWSQSFWTNDLICIIVKTWENISSTDNLNTFLLVNNHSVSIWWRIQLWYLYCQYL